MTCGAENWPAAAAAVFEVAMLGLLGIGMAALLLKAVLSIFSPSAEREL